MVRVSVLLEDEVTPMKPFPVLLALTEPVSPVAEGVLLFFWVALGKEVSGLPPFVDALAVPLGWDDTSVVGLEFPSPEVVGDDA